MKIAFTKKVITPPVGSLIAGYGPNDKTSCKLDDLYVTLLGMNDGATTCVLMAFDLLGMDFDIIHRIRVECAKVFGGAEDQVMLGCSHTHTGPHTRPLPEYDEIMDSDYIEFLVQTCIGATQEIFAQEWIDTFVNYYAMNVNLNVNRRFVTSDNRCSFLPHRRDMERIADGICDKELGIIWFGTKTGNEPVYVIGNYAAHPLAGHCPGIGGHRLSADYPGVFRNYLESEVGCGAMFLQGAAGDMVPKGHETGIAAIQEMGTKLAQHTINGIISAQRDRLSYRLKNETLQFLRKTIPMNVRPCADDKPCGSRKNATTVPFDIQLLSIGDLCIVGVPGELVSELGLEMKWHSPFRKTFINYCSTGYFGYIVHGNALVQGGYEAPRHFGDSWEGLKLVNLAVECEHEAYEKTFPNPADWPENFEDAGANLALKNSPARH